MIGYKPYHMWEVTMHGVPHMRIFEEALRCKYLGGGKPYGKAEFDKWLANYDVGMPFPRYSQQYHTVYLTDRTVGDRDSAILR